MSYAPAGEGSVGVRLMQGSPVYNIIIDCTQLYFKNTTEPNRC